MRTGKVYLNQRCTKWICFVNGQKQEIDFLYEGILCTRTIQFFEYVYLRGKSVVYATFSFNAQKISVPFDDTELLDLTNYFN